MPTPAEIVDLTPFDPPPGESGWVPGQGPRAHIDMVDADPSWPAVFTSLEQQIRTALGDLAVAVEHVGSTAVPGLPAKPIIDIDVTVPDAGDEAAWLPELEALGLVLTVREPWWHEHRCLRGDDPATNVHVFSPGSPEVVRHRLFRDWLIEHPEDLAMYRDTKVAAAAASNAAGEHVMEYNARKESVIHEIYGRVFRGEGLL